MTPAQAVQQLRQELLVNERLATLLTYVAKTYADEKLRLTYTTTNHADLIRLTGVSAGVEDFVKMLTTEVKNSALKDR